MSAAYALEPIILPDGWRAGPLRRPRQMLQAQEYDDHASIHDDATAQKLGFRGGTIEGPTHFSQFDPLGHALWGRRWFEAGAISAHYRNACVEGEAVRALMAPQTEDRRVAIRMEKQDGTEVLVGTMTLGPDHPETALDRRLGELAPLETAVILEHVPVGLKGRRHAVTMGMDQHMGALYPFTLAQKLAVITEPTPWHRGDNPWGRPIVPTEMLSVLMAYTSREDPFPVKGPAVGLFADQEIRLLDGPVFAGERYELERQVMARSGSRRTESLWVRSCLYRAGTDQVVAVMLLNSATLKESYAPYAEELARLTAAG